MAYKIYGIPNCGSVKKAFDFFHSNKIDYTFINFKTDPITEELIDDWLEQCTPEQVINTKGTTWRALDEKIKKSELTKELAKKLVLQNNSIVKRPVIVSRKKIKTIGFDTDIYQKLFKSSK